MHDSRTSRNYAPACSTLARATLHHRTLDVIRHFLSSIPYKPIRHDLAMPPKRSAFARGGAVARSSHRSFRDLLNGEADTATGSISGFEAPVEVGATPAIVALGCAAILVVAAITGF